MRIQDNINLGKVSAAGQLPSNGEQYISQGLRQVANAAGQYANAANERELRLKKQQFASTLIEAEGLADDAALQIHNKYINDNAFSKQAWEDIDPKIKEEWEEQVLKISSKYNLSGELEQEQFQASLDAKYRIARVGLRQAHEKSIKADQIATLEASVAKEAGNLLKAPEFLGGAFNNLDSRIELYGDNYTSEEEHKLRLDGRKSLVVNALEGYLERLDFASVNEILAGTDPETGSVIGTTNLLSVAEIRRYSSAARRLEVSETSQDIADQALARGLSEEDAVTQAQSIEDPEIREAATRSIIVNYSSVRAAKKIERAQVAANLKVGVSRGQVTHEDLNFARENGQISDAVWSELIIKADKAQEDQAEHKIKLSFAADVEAGVAVADPKNSDHRDALDMYFAGPVLEEIREEPERTNARIAEFAESTGYLPKLAQSEIRGGLRSKDSDQRERAVNLLDHVQQIAPSALSDLPAKDIRFGTLVLEYKSSGLDTERAFELAENALEQGDDKLVRQARSDQWLEDKIEDVLKESLLEIADDLDGSEGVFGDEAAVPAQMQADYIRITKAEYEKSGSLETAQRMSRQALTSKWGVTRTGGNKRFMVHPPEAFFSIEDIDSEEWMPLQLRQDVGPLLLEGLDEDTRVLLQSDGETLRTEGKLKSWLVVTVDKDGVVMPIFDQDGAPVRWAPRWKDSDLYYQLEEERKEASIDNAERFYRLRKQRQSGVNCLNAL